MKRGARLCWSALLLIACNPDAEGDEAEGAESPSSSSSAGASTSTASAGTGSSVDSAAGTSSTGGEPSSNGLDTTEATSSGDASDTGGTSGGNIPSDCYSPAQPAAAYDEGAIGCECEDPAKQACVQGVALVCSEARWDAVEDGPCARDQTCHGRLRELDLCFEYFEVCIELGTGTFCGLDPTSDICEDGLLVDSQDGCYADGFCTQLPSGLYCSAGGANACPAPYVEAEAPCSTETFSCFTWAEGFYCRLPEVSREECEGAGGEVIYDPGDGSVSLQGCPDDRQDLGVLTSSGGEGALCCAP